MSITVFAIILLALVLLAGVATVLKMLCVTIAEQAERIQQLELENQDLRSIDHAP